MTARRSITVGPPSWRIWMAAAVACFALGAAVTPALAAPSFGVALEHLEASTDRGDRSLGYNLSLSNIGTDPTEGNVSVTFAFPAGVTFGGIDGPRTSSVAAWSCRPVIATCTTSSVIAPGATLGVLSFRAWIDPDVAPDTLTATAVVYGGSASDATDQDGVLMGPSIPFGIVSLTAGAHDQMGADDTRAGGHPFSAKSSFAVTTYRNSVGINASNSDPIRQPKENMRNNFFDLPVGFIGNPQAVPDVCTITQVRDTACPESAVVGGIDVDVLDGDQDIALSITPIYRVVAEPGYPATFAFRPVTISSLTYVLRPKLRSNGDYGLTVAAPLPPQYPAFREVRSVELCSYGAEIEAATNGMQFTSCKAPGDPGAFAVPLLSNPTECAATAPLTRVALDTYQHPGDLTVDGFADFDDPDWKLRSTTSPLMTGCDSVPFSPAMSVIPTSPVRDSASGLSVDLQVPQDGLVTPDGKATAHLKKTVVELPEGFSVNPSAATGLAACSDRQMASDRLTAPECPPASKLGTVRVTSPLVDQPLTGAMYLGTPKSTDPSSGQMLRLWLAVRNDDLGLSAKLPGTTTADPVTGRLTATFDNNPRVPFDHLEVDLRGGPEGVLATPQDCGLTTATSTLTSWAGQAPAGQPTQTTIAGRCEQQFAPKVVAGVSNPKARGTGTYSFKFSREDGEQWVNGLVAQLPTGLLASVKDLPLCTDAQAAAGSCPAGSKIGTVDATAGTGNPFVLEKKGTAYLTEGYKGCAYGLLVHVPVIAGPFRGDMQLSDINVRQSVCVDPTTAQVTVTSDPLPTIHHGVPLRVRSVTVLVDRPNFMVNPSDCEAKQTGAAFFSTEGTGAVASSPFNISGCAALPFKPKLALSLTGRKQTMTGRHPGIKAKVNQTGIGEAGIEKAVVRLPKSLALDPDNAQALCEFEDGTKDDLENHCPKGSIVGRSRATSPLLNDPLVGNVYFVKNIRIDKKTGNQIRTLPMIIVALRGEIAINLTGESNTTKGGKLVNTFDNVPDAPVSQFNLNIKGGSKGILAVTRTRRSLINLCAKPSGHVAEADMDGQNGRRHDRDIRMKTPCSRKQTKAAKRKAKRAAKARNARG